MGETDAQLIARTAHDPAAFAAVFDRARRALRAQQQGRDRDGGDEAVAPSHSSTGAPAEDEAFGAALREAGHPVKVQVVDGASPGDFLIPGTAAEEATIEHVLEVARG